MLSQRLVEIEWIQKSLQSNKLTIAQTKQSLKLILDQRAVIESYLTNKLPAMFERVRLYDKLTAKAEMF